MKAAPPPKKKTMLLLPTTCSPPAAPYRPHLGLHPGAPLSHQPSRRVPHCPTYPGRSPLTPLANCLSTQGLYLPPIPQLGLPITFLNTLPEPQEAGPTHTALCFPLLVALGTTNLGIDTPYLSRSNGQHSRLCTCSVPPAQLRTCGCSHGVKGWVCLCSHNGR